jgi:nitroreductase
MRNFLIFSLFTLVSCGRTCPQQPQTPAAPPAAAPPAATPPAAQKGTDMQDHPALRNIFSRKSVRRYTGAAPSLEQLTLLVKAGMAAPTAVNRQPWEFIIVTDATLLQTLNDKLPHAKMTAKAGAAIVVLGDRVRQHKGPDTDYWITDCSAAIQNILLAAEAIGLGAVWTAAHPDPERIAAVREVLGVTAEHLVPLAVIPVGHPTGEDQPKDKWDPSRVYLNGYGRKLDSGDQISPK